MKFITIDSLWDLEHSSKIDKFNYVTAYNPIGKTMNAVIKLNMFYRQFSKSPSISLKE